MVRIGPWVSWKIQLVFPAMAPPPARFVDRINLLPPKHRLLQRLLKHAIQLAAELHRPAHHSRFFREQLHSGAVSSFPLLLPPPCPAQL